jgi:hypothetical protein
MVYRPGDKNTKADVLSRRWDHAPKEGSEAAEVVFFKPGQYAGETTLTLGPSAEMRKGNAKASGRVEDPQEQGIQRVGASNVEETLTLGGSGEKRTSSARASATVQDPEVRSAAASARAEGPEVQGTLEGSEVNVLSSASIASTEQVELSTNVLGRVWIPVKWTVSCVSRGPSVSLNFGVFGTDDKLRF